MAGRLCGWPERCLLMASIILYLAPMAHALKYQKWFYWYDGRVGNLTSIVHGVCYNDARAYWLAAQSANGKFNNTGTVTLCYSVEDCILNIMSPSQQQNYAAATVILGLTVRLDFEIL